MNFLCLPGSTPASRAENGNAAGMGLARVRPARRRSAGIPAGGFHAQPLSPERRPYRQAMNTERAKSRPALMRVPRYGDHDRWKNLPTSFCRA